MAIKVTGDFNAGGEPKVFEGKGNSVVARVSVAHNERTEENGVVKDETRWFQVVGFGPAARFIEENVHKGSRLTIEGADLRYGRAYEDKDGVTRTPDELHIIQGRGAKIALKEAAGGRSDQIVSDKPAA